MKIFSVSKEEALEVYDPEEDFMEEALKEILAETGLSAEEVLQDPALYERVKGRVVERYILLLPLEEEETLHFLEVLRQDGPDAALKALREIV